VDPPRTTAVDAPGVRSSLIETSQRPHPPQRGAVRSTLRRSRPGLPTTPHRLGRQLCLESTVRAEGVPRPGSGGPRGSVCARAGRAPDRPGVRAVRRHPATARARRLGRYRSLGGAPPQSRVDGTSRVVPCHPRAGTRRKPSAQAEVAVEDQRPGTRVGVPRGRAPSRRCGWCETPCWAGRGAGEGRVRCAKCGSWQGTVRQRQRS
jgi:hypothetical protein